MGKYSYERYDRQIRLAEIGIAGQEKLKHAKVLVIGAGGLGSPAIMYLSGAGVGTIGIVDSDIVSITNVHRQIIHPEKNAGINKAASASEFIKANNSDVQINIHECLLTEENAVEIISQYDFIIDAVDNFETKFLINDTCVYLKKAFCYAGVIQMHGQVMTYVPDMGACMRCVFEDIPEDGLVEKCVTVGVLGPVCGIIGCIEAVEAIKFITGIGNLLIGRMFIFDALNMNCRIAKFSKPSRTCKACGEINNS
ncbi:MAG: HesA/MoeB/ThiF family protein [Lachnospiraceae bacterium]|nr:HesA/MoeB/ThiF family protein [Lachnospiraceae bacterium]